MPKPTSTAFILAALEAKGLCLNPEADRDDADPPRRLRPDRAAADRSREIDAFLADKCRERLREDGRALPRVAALRRALGQVLARRRRATPTRTATSTPTATGRSPGVIATTSSAPSTPTSRYDRFVQEQLAGDELAGYTPGGDVTPAMVELLTATHFLRNAPDGTGESDGNPDEVRTDRFTVLEGNVQNIMNSCSGSPSSVPRCHDHKFEPITQGNTTAPGDPFPGLQPRRWTKPNDRVVDVGTQKERDEWKRANRADRPAGQGAKAGLASIRRRCASNSSTNGSRTWTRPLRDKIVQGREGAEEEADSRTKCAAEDARRKRSRSATTTWRSGSPSTQRCASR